MSRDVLARWPGLRRLVYQTVFTVVPRLPMRPCQFLGQCLGEAVAFLDWRGRRRVRANLAPLAHILPPQRQPKDLDWWVRRNYRRFCQGMLEQLHLDRIPASWAAEPRLTITDPWRVLGDAHDGQPVAGPGVYIMPHCSWEIIPALMKHLGKFPTIHAIALSHDDDAINELFDQVRSRVGIHTHLLHQAPLASLRALQQGAIFGLVGDRDYTRHGLEVTLAGQRMSLPIGPAAMAVQAQVPLHPAVLLRRGHCQFHLLFGRPLRPDSNAAKRQRVHQLTQLSAAWYERILPLALDQWVVFHPVWRDQKR